MPGPTHHIRAVKGGGEEKNTDAGTENASEQIAADEDAPVCYLIDQTGIFEKDMDTLRSVYMDRNFKTAAKEEEEDIRAHIKENEEDSLIVIEEKDGIPFIHVVNANFMKGISSQRISDICTKIWQKNTLQVSGVDSETIAKSTLSLPYTDESVGNMDVTGYILGLVVVFIMFFYIITDMVSLCPWRQRRLPELWETWWYLQNLPEYSLESVWLWEFWDFYRWLPL